MEPSHLSDGPHLMGYSICYALYPLLGRMRLMLLWHQPYKQPATTIISLFKV